MRIQERSKKLNSSSYAVKTQRINESAGKDFTDVLYKQTQAWQGSLEEVLSKLEEAGARLVKSFSIYDLKAYKDILKAFLKEALGSSYQLREETVWSRFGKPKLMQRIEVINQGMEELTYLTLDKHKDPLKLVAKLDTIRGMLIDLYS